MDDQWCESTHARDDAYVEHGYESCFAINKEKYHGIWFCMYGLFAVLLITLLDTLCPFKNMEACLKFIIFFSPPKFIWIPTLSPYVCPYCIFIHSYILLRSGAWIGLVG